MKHWASLLGPRGIRVNAIAPLIIETDMSKFAQTEAGRNLAFNMQSLRRIAKPDVVADVIALLVSDGARWMTEASIAVNDRSKL